MHDISALYTAKENNDDVSILVLDSIPGCLPVIFQEFS